MYVVGASSDLIKIGKQCVCVCVCVCVCDYLLLNGQKFCIVANLYQCEIKVRITQLHLATDSQSSVCWL